MATNRYQPALLGGLFIGVLSSLPFVKFGNACCCLWVVTGGLLTVYLLQSRQTDPVRTEDALLAGFLAGAIGAVISAVLGLILDPLVGPAERQMALRFLENNPNFPPDVAEQLRQGLEKQPNGAAIALRGVGFFVFFVISSIFSVLGALLGLALFRKTPPPAPPVISV